MRLLSITRKPWWRAPAFESAFNPLFRFVRLRKLAACAIFALAGCLVALNTSIGNHIFLILLLISFTAFALLYKRMKRTAIFCLLLSVLFLFSLYTSYRKETPVISVNKKGDVTGVIASKPSYQPEKNRTTVYLDDVTLDGETFEHKIYLYLYGNNDDGLYEYGQTLYLPEAGLWLPDGQTNPNGFDFRAYLWRKGVAVCASSSVYKAEIIGEEESLTRSLYRFSSFLSARFDALFRENAGVMRALLLGDKSQLDDRAYESFQEAGIAHLVALSGLHVSCVAVLIEFLLFLLMVPAKPRGVIAVFFIFLYTVMTGASASLMRAAMMYAFFVFARFTGNPADLLTRLCGAFLIQIAINPLMIRDTGMQLSYLSVLSLALMVRPIRGLLPHPKSRRADGESIPLTLYNNAADAFSASFAIQLGTLPSMSSLFYSVPLLSVPVNLVVVPLGLATVYLGASAVILSFVSMEAAALLGKAPDLIWTAIRFITDRVSDISFATMNVRAWSGWATAVYFLIMALASPFLTDNRRRASGLTVISCAMAVMVLLWPAPVHKGLDIVFLDAGYADSCVVLAENDAYVVDCGKDNGITADYLTGIGADVKGIFLTHPDVDHSGGVGEVLKRYPEAEVYVSECWHRMDVGELVSEALSGKTLHYLSEGDEISLGGAIEAQVAWPECGFTPKEDNDGSLVLNIVYGEASALLTGDATERVDKHIQADSDLLKVAHHGSKKATSEAFLSAVTPEIAVISVSSNGHGHPTQEVLSRLSDIGCSVYRTDQCGAITVTMLEDGTYHVKTELASGG